MSHCPDVQPKFQDQINSTDPQGGRSCTTYSAAMLIDLDTCGRVIPTGKRVRELTGDTSGGINLGQVDYVAREYFDVDFDTRYRYLWSEFARRIDKGEAAILQGWYAPIADSRFDAGRGFRGNHAICIPPDWATLDPLADGRAAGVYQYKGEPYPKALLRDFAGRLNIGSDPDTYRRLGDGYVYASFSRDITAIWQAILPAASYWVYTVSGGEVRSRESRLRTTTATVPCGPPRSYPWPGHTRKSLVKVTKGALLGKYVSSTYAKEVP
jgi:hypothetical protein